MLQVLGVHIVGPDAAEILQGVAIAMKYAPYAPTQHRRPPINLPCF